MMMKMFENIAQHLWGSSLQPALTLESRLPYKNIEQSDLDPEEKRLATRIEVDAEVWYRVRTDSSKWNYTKSKDYSSTGIRLVLLHPLAPGTAIEMKIKLSELEEPLRIQGHVVWVAQTNHRHSLNRVVECGVSFSSVQQNSHKEQLIYLIADKLCHLGLKATKHLHSAPAQNMDELKACYSIVYKGYSARGYCQPNDSQMFYHYYSFLPKSRTFALKDKEKVLGTISIIVDSPCGIPMDKLFPEQIDHLRRQGRKLAEVTLLAMDHSQNKRLFSLTNFEKQARLFRLFKIMYEYALHVAGVTDLIIGVHPKHESLYRYLKFRPLASVKCYDGACGNLALPLHLQIAGLAEKYSTSLRSFFCSDAATSEHLQGGISMDAECVKFFLFEKQSLWPQVPSNSQKHILECYPELSKHPQTVSSTDTMNRIKIHET